MKLQGVLALPRIEGNEETPDMTPTSSPQVLIDRRKVVKKSTDSRKNFSIHRSKSFSPRTTARSTPFPLQPLLIDMKDGNESVESTLLSPLSSSAASSLKGLTPRRRGDDILSPSILPYPSPSSGESLTPTPTSRPDLVSNRSNTKQNVSTNNANEDKSDANHRINELIASSQPHVLALSHRLRSLRVLKKLWKRNDIEGVIYHISSLLDTIEEHSVSTSSPISSSNPIIQQIVEFFNCIDFGNYPDDPTTNRSNMNDSIDMTVISRSMYTRQNSQTVLSFHQAIGFLTILNASLRIKNMDMMSSASIDVLSYHLQTILCKVMQIYDIFKEFIMYGKSAMNPSMTGPSSGSNASSMDIYRDERARKYRQFDIYMNKIKRKINVYCTYVQERCQGWGRFDQAGKTIAKEEGPDSRNAFDGIHMNSSIDKDGELTSRGEGDYAVNHEKREYFSEVSVDQSIDNPPPRDEDTPSSDILFTPSNQEMKKKASVLVASTPKKITSWREYLQVSNGDLYKLIELFQSATSIDINRSPSTKPRLSISPMRRRQSRSPSLDAMKEKIRSPTGSSKSNTAPASNIERMASATVLRLLWERGNIDAVIDHLNNVLNDVVIYTYPPPVANTPPILLRGKSMPVLPLSSPRTSTSSSSISPTRSGDDSNAWTGNFSPERLLLGVTPDVNINPLIQQALQFFGTVDFYRGNSISRAFNASFAYASPSSGQVTSSASTKTNLSFQHAIGFMSILNQIFYIVNSHELMAISRSIISFYVEIILDKVIQLYEIFYDYIKQTRAIAATPAGMGGVNIVLDERIKKYKLFDESLTEIKLKVEEFNANIINYPGEPSSGENAKLQDTLNKFSNITKVESPMRYVASPRDKRLSK